MIPNKLIDSAITLSIVYPKILKMLDDSIPPTTLKEDCSSLGDFITCMWGKCRLLVGTADIIVKMLVTASVMAKPFRDR